MSHAGSKSGARLLCFLVPLSLLRDHSTASRYILVYRNRRLDSIRTNLCQMLQPRKKHVSLGYFLLAGIQQHKPKVLFLHILYQAHFDAQVSTIALNLFPNVFYYSDTLHSWYINSCFAVIRINDALICQLLINWVHNTINIMPLLKSEMQ